MSYSERINAVKSEIDSLITYANETTGNSDSTIGNAVKSLADGYGGGGSGSELKLIAKADFTVESEIVNTATTLANLDIFSEIENAFESAGKIANDAYMYCIYVISAKSVSSENTHFVCASENFKIYCDMIYSKPTFRSYCISSYHKWCNSDGTMTQAGNNGVVPGSLGTGCYGNTWFSKEGQTTPILAGNQVTIAAGTYTVEILEFDLQ